MKGANTSRRIFLMQDIEDDEVGPVDAAEILGLSPATLANMRHYRRGPAYRKAGNGRVFYLRADLDAWLTGYHRRAA